MIEKGVSFCGADILSIREVLCAEVSGNDYEGNLAKRAGRISKTLRYNMGKGQWQVCLVKGAHAKRFASSCNYIAIFQKKDGLRAYVWLNRFVNCP